MLVGLVGDVLSYCISRLSAWWNGVPPSNQSFISWVYDVLTKNILNIAISTLIAPFTTSCAGIIAGGIVCAISSSIIAEKVAKSQMTLTTIPSQIFYGIINIPKTVLQGLGWRFSINVGVDGIPTRQYLVDDINNIPDTLICYICHNLLLDAVSLTNQYYCKDCLQVWIDIRHSNPINPDRPATMENILIPRDIRIIVERFVNVKGINIVQ